MKPLQGNNHAQQKEKAPPPPGRLFLQPGGHGARDLHVERGSGSPAFNKAKGEKKRREA